MGNPTAIDGELAVLVAGTDDVAVTLDPRREYTLAHDGENVSGSEDTNTVYLAIGAAATATAAEGANKFKLKNGRAVVVGPGADVLHFKTAAGAPTLSVSPSQVIPPNMR